MIKALLRLAGACVIAASAHAADPLALTPNHPDTYVVKQGDTLWGISKMFLQSPWLWPEIWQVNPQIENPHLIFPGDQLSLVYEGGKPRIKVSRGTASRTVKLGPQVRVEPIDNAIPAIPLDKIGPFLSRSRVMGDAELNSAAYVIAGGDRHVVAGAGDELYARGNFNQEDEVYGVYRRGRTFTDPDTQEILGLEARDIGGVKFKSKQGEVARFQVNRSSEEIRVSDLLLPFEEDHLVATYYPRPPARPVSGKIIEVEEGVAGVGAYDVVVLNRGHKHGLDEGVVLAINKLGETVKDPRTGESLKLPDEQAGLMMVFRAYEKVSYAIVLEASRPLSVKDTFNQP